MNWFNGGYADDIAMNFTTNINIELQNVTKKTLITLEK